jgi:ribosomal protein L29
MTLCRPSSRTGVAMSTELKPFAVPLRGKGRELLGNKAVSEIYEEVAAGNLELVKDGKRSLLTLRSIEAYQASWKPARIKQYRRNKKPPDDTS